MSAITPYVTSPDSSVFAVRNLPEEVVAVLFAYYSRSPFSLRENLAKMLEEGHLVGEPDWQCLRSGLEHMANNPMYEEGLEALEDWLDARNQTPEKARSFHEKWVVGYGHACYSADTEVLTDEGWVAWPELLASAQADSTGLFTDRQLRTWSQGRPNFDAYQAIGLYEYDYDAPMCHFHSDEVDLLVTPNHRMYGRMGLQGYPHTVTQPVFITAERLILWLSKDPARTFSVFTYEGDAETPLPSRSREKGVEIRSSRNMISRHLTILNVEPLSYQGKVYCATVPTGRLLVRRNGKMAVCGNSVAEHAVVHLAAENVSLLAAKEIEESRLASYTEKSSRYVKFGPGGYLSPTEIGIPGTAIEAEYEQLMTLALETYQLVHGYTSAHIERTRTQPEDWSDARWNGWVNSRTCDMARYCLPLSMRTSLGITVNATSLRGMVERMQGSPLPEVKLLGQALLEHAKQVAPVLLQYTTPRTCPGQAYPAMRSRYGNVDLSTATAHSRRGADVKLDAVQPDEMEVLLDLAWAFLVEGMPSPTPFWPEHVSRLEAPAIVDRVLSTRQERRCLPRTCEHALYRMSLALDCGAWRDLQRHRMMSQQSGLVGVPHGYSTPPPFEEIEMVDGRPIESPYRKLMEAAAKVWRHVFEEFGPEKAQYVLPMAYRRQMIATLNLRELAHLIELRTRPQGHPSYRLVAHELYRQLQAQHPMLAGYLRPDPSGVAWIPDPASDPR